jgi:hypothetical protein
LAGHPVIFRRGMEYISADHLINPAPDGQL